MKREELVHKLCEMAASQVDVERKEISPNAHLLHDIGFDSLDQAEFILAVEDAFDIDVPDEQASGVQTIEDAADVITSLLHTPSAP